MRDPVKLDEEKSKHAAGLAQENGFGSLSIMHSLQ
jgi:hypothetical protein